MKYLLFFGLLSSLVFAAPAFNKEKRFYNQDGGSFLGTPQGNHHLNWIKTQDGAIVVYNPETKNFEYATIKEDELRPSEVTYKAHANSSTQKAASKNMQEDVYKLWRKKQKNTRF
jgi:hypothetical protein